MLLRLINYAHSALVNLADDFVAEIVGNGFELSHGADVDLVARQVKEGTSFGKKVLRPLILRGFSLAGRCPLAVTRQQFDLPSMSSGSTHITPHNISPWLKP
jgi:hypothetical protein